MCLPELCVPNSKVHGLYVWVTVETGPLTRKFVWNEATGLCLVQSPRVLHKTVWSRAQRQPFQGRQDVGLLRAVERSWAVTVLLTPSPRLLLVVTCHFCCWIFCRDGQIQAMEPAKQGAPVPKSRLTPRERVLPRGTTVRWWDFMGYSSREGSPGFRDVFWKGLWGYGSQASHFLRVARWAVFSGCPRLLTCCLTAGSKWLACVL